MVANLKERTYKNGIYRWQLRLFPSIFILSMGKIGYGNWLKNRHCIPYLRFTRRQVSFPAFVHLRKHVQINYITLIATRSNVQGIKMSNFYKRFLFISLSVLMIGIAGSRAHAQNFTLSGTIADVQSGEMIIGATVFDPSSGKGTAANSYGFYSLTLPAGSYIITIQSIGYQALIDTLLLNGNTNRNYKLNTAQIQLQEVIINGEEDGTQGGRNPIQMGIQKIPLKLFKSIPAVGGEADIMKMIQLMPGVLQGVEGTTGMFVRGGDADQNLILLDEAVVYNASHLFGFFSVFNPETLKNVTLIKSSFPSSYGGRLSSVLDIRMKEGNNQRFSAEGGIGLLSSRITLQGPLTKGKSSFMIAGRRTYIDQVAKAVNRTVPYYFYDLNAKANFYLSAKDRIYYSTYFGNDILDLSSVRQDTSSGKVDIIDFGSKTGNFTNTLRWNHIYNQKLFSNLSLIQTHFRYNVEGQFSENTLRAKSSINDIGLKADYTYYKNSTIQMGFGASVVNHYFRPSIVNTSGSILNYIASPRGKLLSTFESGVYSWVEQQVSRAFQINYGLRLSMANVTVKNYVGAEPRLSMRYLWAGAHAFKLGVSRMKQYMHLVSSSSFSLPTDLWYPVTDSIKPQTADQVSLGYSKRFEKMDTDLTVEVYYKKMRNVIEYRPGAQLLLNNNYESELIAGKGQAYGLELLLQKNAGSLSGWIGYTLSWSQRQFDQLNNGKPFFARYDRRHNISVVGIYQFNPRLSFSATWVFLSGARFTPPIGQFGITNSGYSGIDVLPIYTSRNSIKLPNSHRLDVNLIIKNKPTRRWAGEWHLGAYNAYNRSQPYRIDLRKDKNGNYQYYTQGLFGFIPSIAYNFKF